jgi:hypothetical protein
MGTPESVRYISYSANGGTGSMADQTFRIGEAQNLSSNAFKREGFVFKCWNTMTDGSGKSYQPGDSFTFGTSDTDITLYAQWDPFGPYTVYYIDTLYNKTYTQTVGYNQEAKLIKKSEMGFDDPATIWNWNTAKNGSGTPYEDEQDIYNEVLPSATLTLYAMRSGKLTYDPNDGSGQIVEQVFIYNNPVKLKTNERPFEKSGRIFHGWITKKGSSGEGVRYDEGQVVQEGFSGDVTLYAYWGYKYDGKFTVNASKFEDNLQQKKPDGFKYNNDYYVIVATGPVYSDAEKKKPVTVKIGNGPYCYIGATSDVSYTAYDLRTNTNFYKDDSTDVLVLVGGNYIKFQDGKIPSMEYMSSWGNPLVHTEDDKFDYRIADILLAFTNVQIWSGTKNPEDSSQAYYVSTHDSNRFWSPLSGTGMKYVILSSLF